MTVKAFYSTFLFYREVTINTGEPVFMREIMVTQSFLKKPVQTLIQRCNCRKGYFLSLIDNIMLKMGIHMQMRSFLKSIAYGSYISVWLDLVESWVKWRNNIFGPIVPVLVLSAHSHSTSSYRKKNANLTCVCSPIQTFLLQVRRQIVQTIVLNKPEGK